MLLSVTQLRGELATERARVADVGGVDRNQHGAVLKRLVRSGAPKRIAARDRGLVWSVLRAFVRFRNARGAPLLPCNLGRAGYSVRAS